MLLNDIFPTLNSTILLYYVIHWCRDSNSSGRPTDDTFSFTLYDSNDDDDDDDCEWKLLRIGIPDISTPLRFINKTRDYYSATKVQFIIILNNPISRSCFTFCSISLVDLILDAIILFVSSPVLTWFYSLSRHNIYVVYILLLYLRTRVHIIIIPTHPHTYYTAQVPAKSPVFLNSFLYIYIYWRVSFSLNNISKWTELSPT